MTSGGRQSKALGFKSVCPRCHLPGPPPAPHTPLSQLNSALHIVAKSGEAADAARPRSDGGDGGKGDGGKGGDGVGHAAAGGRGSGVRRVCG